MHRCRVLSQATTLKIHRHAHARCSQLKTTEPNEATRSLLEFGRHGAKHGASDALGGGVAPRDAPTPVQRQKRQHREKKRRWYGGGLGQRCWRRRKRRRQIWHLTSLSSSFRAASERSSDKSAVSPEHPSRRLSWTHHRAPAAPRSRTVHRSEEERWTPTHRLGHNTAAPLHSPLIEGGEVDSQAPLGPRHQSSAPLVAGWRRRGGFLLPFRPLCAAHHLS